MYARLAQAQIAYLHPISPSPAEERLAALRQAAEDAQRAALRQAVGRVLARIGGALRHWIERARIRAELEAMTDRELADIGLTRGDFDRVVHGTAPEAETPAPRRPVRPAGNAAPQPA